MNKRKTYEKIRKFFNIVLVILVVIVVISLSSLVIQKLIFNEEVPSIFGIKILQVMSGSMSSTLNVGDVILIKEVTDASELQIGDIITYKSGDSLVTHRIVDITKTNGELTFTTKGDANNQKDDEKITISNIEGKYLIKVKFIGTFLTIMETPVGMTIVIMVPVLLIVALIYQDRKREEKRNKRREKRLKYEFQRKLKEKEEKNIEENHNFKLLDFQQDEDLDEKDYLEDEKETIEKETIEPEKDYMEDIKETIEKALTDIAEDTNDKQTEKTAEVVNNKDTVELMEEDNWNAVELLKDVNDSITNDIETKETTENVNDEELQENTTEVQNDITGIKKIEDIIKNMKETWNIEDTQNAKEDLYEQEIKATEEDISSKTEEVQSNNEEENTAEVIIETQKESYNYEVVPEILEEAETIEEQNEEQAIENTEEQIEIQEDNYEVIPEKVEEPQIEEQKKFEEIEKIQEENYNSGVKIEIMKKTEIVEDTNDIDKQTETIQPDRFETTIGDINHREKRRDKKRNKIKAKRLKQKERRK